MPSTTAHTTERRQGPVPPEAWDRLVRAVDREELAAAASHTVRVLRRVMRRRKEAPRMAFAAADLILRLEKARMRHGYGSSFRDPPDELDADVLGDEDVLDQIGGEPHEGGEPPQLARLLALLGDDD